MAGTQNIQRMITSAKNLQSIVGTMKAYASSNIVQFQTAARASMEYNNILNMSLYILLSGIYEKSESRKTYENQGSIHIVLGSDHGLAGRFNENISSFAENNIELKKNDKIIVIGQQVFSRISNQFNISDSFNSPQSVEAITSSVLDILFKIEEYRTLMESDINIRGMKSIILYYNSPGDDVAFKERKELLYPIDFDSIVRKRGAWESKSLPTYLADRESLFSDLLKQYFFIILYRTFCYSLASENASRLSSMQAAEKNIEERLETLQSRYRRQRQNEITEELNDVISGFKAIKKSKR